MAIALRPQPYPLLTPPGITNAPIDWAKEHNQSRHILEPLLSIIAVSLETMKIVKKLPRLEFE